MAAHPGSDHRDLADPRRRSATVSEMSRPLERLGGRLAGRRASTVNERSALSSAETGSFWMIMSTFTLASASAPKTRPAIPGSSRRPLSVTRASSACVTAVTEGRSMVSCSERTRVPGPSSNELRHSMRMPWFLAYSTDRSCSTRAPEAAISSISSKETYGSRRASVDEPRIGAEHAAHVGVDLADLGAQRGGDRDRGRVRAAAAERRDVAAVARDPLEPGDEHDPVLVERVANAIGAHVQDPRLGVRGVGDDPGLRPGQRDRVVAEVVDRHRAERARDPLAGREQHVHLPRRGRVGDLVGHARRARRWSCRAPRGPRRRACPPRRAATIRPAARRMSSGSATEVPPNFITTISLVVAAMAG